MIVCLLANYSIYTYFASTNLHWVRTNRCAQASWKIFASCANALDKIRASAILAKSMPHSCMMTHVTISFESKLRIQFIVCSFKRQQNTSKNHIALSKQQMQQTNCLNRTLSSAILFCLLSIIYLNKMRFIKISTDHLLCRFCLASLLPISCEWIRFPTQNPTKADLFTLNAVDAVCHISYGFVYRLDDGRDPCNCLIYTF